MREEGLLQLLDATETMRKLSIMVPTNPLSTTKSVLTYTEFVTTVITDGMNLTTVRMDPDLKTTGLTFPCQISSNIIDSIKLNVT